MLKIQLMRIVGDGVIFRDISSDVWTGGCMKGGLDGLKHASSDHHRYHVDGAEMADQFALYITG